MDPIDKSESNDIDDSCDHDQNSSLALMLPTPISQTVSTNANDENEADPDYFPSTMEMLLFVRDMIEDQMDEVEAPVQRTQPKRNRQSRKENKPRTASTSRTRSQSQRRTSRKSKPASSTARKNSRAKSNSRSKSSNRKATTKRSFSGRR